MFPFRDHNPSRHTPIVTWSLIALNLALFAFYWSQLPNERALAEFFFRWGLVPARSDPMTFVSSMFLHGGFMHLAGNMLFLWVFGDNMEDQMGRLGFLMFYFLGGFAASAAQIVSDPGSNIPIVGASGAIAGVMGGYLLMFPKARVDVLLFLVIYIRVIPIPAWIVLGVWFGMQLFQGASVASDQGGVAYWAHAGGFLAGLGMTLPLWQKRGGPAFWRRTEGHPPNPDAEYRLVKTSVPRVRQ